MPYIYICIEYQKYILYIYHILRTQLIISLVHCICRMTYEYCMFHGCRGTGKYIYIHILIRLLEFLAHVGQTGVLHTDPKCVYHMQFLVGPSATVPVCKASSYIAAGHVHPRSRRRSETLARLGRLGTPAGHPT